MRTVNTPNIQTDRGGNVTRARIVMRWLAPHMTAAKTPAFLMRELGITPDEACDICELLETEHAHGLGALAGGGRSTSASAFISTGGGPA